MDENSGARQEHSDNRAAKRDDAVESLEVFSLLPEERKQ
jgi:hypothetical protein